ncbi:complement component C7 [Osmerus eperlanus]|uniref:complement component C7 n=1 Tax=Osmerus eperlanus TaxID=29151 RepID=UPI002E15E7B0
MIHTLTMKTSVTISLACLWLLSLLVSPSEANCVSLPIPWLFQTINFCFGVSHVDPVHCTWGSWGEWSVCDGCSKSQSRVRPMEIYAQFGGNPCGGGPTETRECSTTQGCPLQDGCGDRFRCRSGQCISMSLKCNGDQDCEEDNQDELSQTCPSQVFSVCDIDQPPPNIELLGLGFDIVTGKTRGSVINTKSFGGQCRTIFSGDNRRRYRLPQSIIKYNTEVTVRNEFSDELFESTWSYLKEIEKREKTTGTTTGHYNYNYKLEETKYEKNMLMTIDNEIEMAQYQSNAPRYLTLSEEFWKALTRLPNVYDYASYSKVLERFGTHYRTRGTLGGKLRIVISLNEKTVKKIESVKWDYNKCVKKKRSFLFIKWTTEKCTKDSHDKVPFNEDLSESDAVQNVILTGGYTEHVEGLKHIDLRNPTENGRIYKNWADSLKSFPGVFKEKLAPISELVKEVQCAGLKRIYLRQAIEQYLAERHTCRCRPCQNNGVALREKDICKCLCKPGTKGDACETGTDVEEQAGVIHGRWSCWSDWTSCTGGVMRRTRQCNNPAPQNGGQHCIGETAEREPCDDDLEDIKNMEPQCFDSSLPAKEACTSPPPLYNGFVLNPRDVHLMGTTVEYTCIDGHYLVGEKTAECKSDKTWTTPDKHCKRSKCGVPILSDQVTASVWNNSYDIGQKITLSCPQGRLVLGEKEIICDSSLKWSPNPQNIECSEEVAAPDPTRTADIKCKSWEKTVDQACVCRTPNECPSSLEVCATNIKRGRTDLISVCKMHAVQCMGMSMKLAEDNSCEWPNHESTPCNKCQLWQTCNDQTNVCRCKDETECVGPGLSVCARVGDASVSQTMTECEAGRRRCNGEKITVVSILPCEA